MAAFESLKTVDLREVSGKVQDYIDNIKAGLTGEESFKEKISKEFIVPTEGDIISGYGTRLDPDTNNNVFHYGVDINAQEGAEVKCSSDGVVKFIGEDETLGKYIIIDHSIGIETKYCNLKEIWVENGAGITSGEVIASVGSSAETKTPHLHFELLYMGENKNPEEYINFASILQ
jgi:murein DD-endopeptidase MepM/ murein hydrolase activator NlpD